MGWLSKGDYRLGEKDARLEVIDDAWATGPVTRGNAPVVENLEDAISLRNPGTLLINAPKTIGLEVQRDVTTVFACAACSALHIHLTIQY